MTTPSDTTKQQTPVESNGYLYCRKCHGYYRLQDGESKDDFVSCECGWELDFYESLPDKFSDDYSEVDEIDDTEEIEQLLTLLKSKSAKRKAILKNLSKHIHIQEEMLNEIKDERWTLWDVLNERNLQTDIRNQKRLLDDISENEDRLLSIVREKRNGAQDDQSSFTDVFKNVATSYIIIIGAIIIILVLLILLII
jgi:hypothetical protein